MPTSLYNVIAMTPNGSYANAFSALAVVSGPDNTVVTLSFGPFSLEPPLDFLTLYDGPGPGARVLGVYSGTQLQDVALTGSTSSLTLQVGRGMSSCVWRCESGKAGPVSMCILVCGVGRCLNCAESLT